MRTIKAWGGFSDGALYTEGARYSSHTGDDAMWAVFRKREDAARLYDDVRPLLIIVEPGKR